MPFVKIEAHGLAANTASRQPITMSMNAGLARVRRLMRITIRGEILPPELYWLKVGASVSIEEGVGVDDGYLRITPKGSFLLKLCGGLRRDAKIASRPFGLTMRPLETAKAGAFNATQVECQAIEGALRIELPDWAYTPAPKPIPADKTAPLVARDVGAPFKLGAPSQAEVHKVRGVPGA